MELTAKALKQAVKTLKKSTSRKRRRQFRWVSETYL